MLESKSKKTSEFRKKKNIIKPNNCVLLNSKDNEFRKRSVTILNNNVLQKSKDSESKKKSVIASKKKLVSPKLKDLRSKKS